jgi:hypothetical protein
MALTVLNIPPLDPNMKTGPTRIMSGPVRMRTVTPGTPYGEFATWLYAGGTGDVSIIEWDGTSITLTGLAAGFWHPVYSIGVNVTGTTATGLLWAS